MVSLTNALREANEDLKIQLRKERTEERRKMFKADQNQVEDVQAPSAIAARWKKVLDSTSPTTPTVFNSEEEKAHARKGKPNLI